LETFEVRN
jgi:hypothetical protein